MGDGPAPSNAVAHGPTPSHRTRDNGVRCKRQRSSSQPGSLDDAARRCMRMGGAFGKLYHLSDQLAVARRALASTRCDVGLSVADGAFVALPVDDGAGIMPIWMSPDTVAAPHCWRW